MPNQPPLNPDAIQEAAVASRHALWDEDFWGFSSESDAQDYGFEEGAKWALKQSTADTVLTVDELNALPEESVILDADNFPYRKTLRSSFTESVWEGIDCGDPLEVDTLTFPATVIYQPEQQA